MSKQNIKVVKSKETKKDLIYKRLTLAISVIALLHSMYIGNKTNSIAERQNQFTRKMQLSVQSQKDNLQNVHNTVSQTETVSNNILLREVYQPSNKEKLENLSNTSSKIQNNYYNDLNQKNRYAGQLDKAITVSLTNTRNIIDVILSSTEKTTNYNTQSTSNNKVVKILPKTGGQDPHLEEIFNNYQKEEQSQINKNANWFKSHPTRGVS